MSIVQVLGESAVRSLVLALAAAVLIRMLGVRHARLAKRAWTAVLVLSLAMPALVALRFPSFSITALWSAPRVVVVPAWPSNSHRAFDTVPDTYTAPPPAQMAAPAPVFQLQPPVPAALQGPPAQQRRLVWWQIGFAAYLTITAVLLLRLLLGLALAARLWHRAQIFATTETDLPVRLSVDLRSPATVGRGILLPLEAIEWDDAALRATLAHEAQHIREGDFYLQLAATLHHCFFWIGPHAWWLRPRLSSLSETICDRAAVYAGNDGLSYAQLLLRLATAEQTPAGMVAMAQSAGLRERIDRLIADPDLAGSFRKRRGQGWLAAALLAAAALVAAVSVHLVQPAAIVLAAPHAPAPPTPPAAASDAQAPAAAPQAIEIAPAAKLLPPSLRSAPPVLPDPQLRSGADVMLGQGVTLRDLPTPRALGHVLPMTPNPHMAPVPLPSVSMARPLDIPSRIIPMRVMKLMVLTGDDSNVSICVPSRPDASATCELNGFTVTAGPGSHPGGAILFERGGKTYIIDDPTLVKQAQQAYARVEELGKQQGDLGAKQGKLGAQEGDLGALQGQIGELQGELNGIQFGFASGSFQFEMPKDFDNSVQVFADDTVKLALDEKLSQQERAQLEAEQKQAQANFDKAMADWKAQEPQRQALEKQMRDQAEQMRKQMQPLIDKMHELGAKEGELGRLQGELGRRQALLGVQQREASREATQKVQSLIDQAVKDGKAHPAQ